MDDSFDAYRNELHIPSPPTDSRILHEARSVITVNNAGSDATTRINSAINLGESGPK